MSQYWKGIALPWGLTIPSVFEPKDDFNVLKSSILWILLTGLGERVMLPEFGSRLQELVFDPNDLTLANEIKSSISDAINRWDDRVELVDFSVEPDGNELICQVLFRFATDELQNDVQRVEFTLSQDMFT